jgi:hypothetical protein
MYNNIDIFSLLKKEGKLEKILVYPAQEIIIDPYKKSKELSFLNPIPLDALVRQVSFGAVTWKHYGQIPQDSFELLIEGNQWTNLLLISDKIKIRNNYYKTLKDDKGFRYLQRQEYVIIVVSRKVND